MDIRRLVKTVVGEYDLWHIFSILTDDCRPMRGFTLAQVQPLEDLSIFDRPDSDAEVRKSNYSSPSGAYGFTATVDGELAGLCWYWTGELLNHRNVGPLARDEAELLQILVIERFRDQHIGRSLISETSLRMREAGYRRLYAQIWHSNTPSKHAFGAAGWKHVASVYRISPSWRTTPITLRYKLHSADPDVLTNWEGKSGILR